MKPCFDLEKIKHVYSDLIEIRFYPFTHSVLETWINISSNECYFAPTGLCCNPEIEKKQKVIRKY